MDGVSPKFVKLPRYILSRYLAKLFNKCIEQEIFPCNFKAAYVILIPKTLFPKSLNEFHSIFLFSVFFKQFEQVIKNKMLEFIDKNNILTFFQFSFKAKILPN